MDIAASFMEGFSGIEVVDGVRLASLEKRNVVGKIQLLAPGTAARMKIALKRSLSMNKSLLLLYWGSVNGGRAGSRISCIPFQKVNKM